MSKKQDKFYFDNFVACVDCATKSAQALHLAFEQFDPDNLRPCLDELHKLEHDADTKKHELLNTLAKAFITPIEREDIIALSQNIDEMVDNIEDVLMRIYCNNVRTIRPDSLKITEVLVRSAETVKSLMEEFENFKHSKNLRDYIIKINTLEEEADRHFISCLRDLHTTCTDPLEVMAWHEVYSFLEKCVDSCEHVADCVETVIMKNT